MNADLDGYCKTVNMQKKTTYWKPNYKLGGGQVFTFSLPEGAVGPSATPSVTPLSLSSNKF